MVERYTHMIDIWCRLLDSICCMHISPSLGIDVGTGGSVHNVARSVPYGESFGSVGDVVRVDVDVDNKTVEFFKNRQSQGVVTCAEMHAPVFAAVSLTAAGSSVRLTILS